MLPPTMQWLPQIPALRLLDQRAIPDAICFCDCRTYEDVARAIEDMTVRGAPAIGIAAAYGVVLAARGGEADIMAGIDRLAKTRPTAVNLYWALDRMKKLINRYPGNDELASVLEAEAVLMHKEDIAVNKKLSYYGQQLLPECATVITHCNAGALATAGYGTALGVFRAASENGKKMKIYADETRPRFQGGRITSFELYEDGFDVTVICDSMAAFLMSREKIDAVITGADRIALNGDTANKIGTYGLAIAAEKHNVPFYIAAPLSTIDMNCPNGNAIQIEERSHDEIRIIGSEVVIPERIAVWNPAFDITPAGLITGIITEAGIISRPDAVKIEGLKHYKDKKGMTSY